MKNKTVSSVLERIGVEKLASFGSASWLRSISGAPAHRRAPALMFIIHASVLYRADLQAGVGNHQQGLRAGHVLGGLGQGKHAPRWEFHSRGWRALPLLDRWQLHVFILLRPSVHLHTHI